VTDQLGGELEMFRSTLRRFFERELVPRNGMFESDADRRAYWRKAGEIGLLGAAIPEAYGGPGLDRLSVVVMSEELGRLPAGAIAGPNLTADLCTVLLVDHGTEAQKREWLPRILDGSVIQTLALTEPGAGSDAGAIQTTARREGDAYILNGAKHFISTGTWADVIYVVAKTDAASRTTGMSVFLVRGDAPGVTRRKMATLGYHGGDTAEIVLDGVVVPATDLMGQEGRAYGMFDTVITLDRFHIAARSWAASQAAFEMTLAHAQQRKMFGQRLIDLQNAQFKLAGIETDLAVGRSFIDRCIAKYRAGAFTQADGSMLKIWLPEMEGRVMDACLQLWGGYGWMADHPIAHMFTAARLQRIWAGATELHLSILGRRYLK
jgi:acyl-CoA dehydrogenase